MSATTATTEALSAASLTMEARRYAVRELARRAGVSRQWFQTWKVDVQSERTSVSFGSDHSKTIHFDHASKVVLERIARGDFPVARAASVEMQGGDSPAPYLIVPGCEPTAEAAVPLFHRLNADESLCRLDLLLSLVFTTARVEESSSARRDEHGRFLASGSLAKRHNFLGRPIVDEWGIPLETEIAALLPGWKPQGRELRLNITHDVDDVGMPFNVRAAIGHSIVRRNPLATLRDFASLAGGLETYELGLVRRLATISLDRGFHSSFFWKGSSAGPRDSGYDPFHPKIQAVIRQLRDQGFTLGVHPGYETFGSRKSLSQEIDRLRKALGTESLGGRQHYLRWTPETWVDWEACGLAFDSSVGFAEEMGFRAGTSYAYRPWSFSQNRELNLIEVPLILMDCTPVKYMRLARHTGLERIRESVRRTAAVGGIFTLLWHNVPLMEPEYNGWYEAILDMLKDARAFKVPSADSLW